MTVSILTGDCRQLLKQMPSASVHCCVTSPPYFGLRDYGVDGQTGLEPTPAEFVAELVDVFAEVRRVLRDDGTLWLNLGDSYNNFRVSKGPGQAVHGRDNLNGKPAPDSGRRGWSVLKEKDLIGIPWRVAFALQSDGWYLRSDIIWHKPNPMPESVTDRPTKSHEYLFLLSKNERYFFDADAVKEPLQTDPKENYPARAKILGRGGQPASSQSGKNECDNSGGFAPAGEGRNIRTVWTVATQPFKGAHFATFPQKLIEPCIKAGCPVGGVVLDPFGGAGTTGLVADRLGCDAILLELNPAYAAMAAERIDGAFLL